MEGKFESKHDKVSQKTLEKVEKKIEEMKTEVNYKYDFRNNPDLFSIDIKDGDKIKKTINITKVGEQFPIKAGEQYVADKKTGRRTKVPMRDHYPYEEIIEASLRFPNDSIVDALQKTEEIKEEKKKENK